MAHRGPHPRIVRDAPGASRERSDSSQSVSSHASSCSTCYGRPPADDAVEFLAIHRIVRRNLVAFCVFDVEVMVECNIDGVGVQDERSYIVTQRLRERVQTPTGVREICDYTYMVDQSRYDRLATIDEYRRRLTERVYFVCPHHFVEMFEARLRVFTRVLEPWMCAQNFRILCGEHMELPPILWGNEELREVRASPAFQGVIDSVIITTWRVNLRQIHIRRLRKFVPSDTPGRIYYFEQTIRRDDTPAGGSWVLSNLEFVRFVQPYLPRGF